jgi:hypothetical protein
LAAQVPRQVTNWYCQPALLREYLGCDYQDLGKVLKEGEKYGYARRTTRRSGDVRWDYELDLDYARYNLSRQYEQRYADGQ